MNPYLLGAIFGALMFVLVGCAGSPRITITKNVYVIKSANAKITYKTESANSSVAEIVQDLKDLLKVTPR